MSAAARIKALAPAPTVELVRATCTVCRAPRALCASISDVVDVCFGCALSISQFIASAERASARPHDKPCFCGDCQVFDEGQRGEVAQIDLVDANAVADDDVVSRWLVLEVD